MELKKLIEEYQDCHDKERLQQLKAEIDKHTQDYISRCIDYQLDLINS